MGHQIVFVDCHPTKQKNNDFAALPRLSLDGEELDGSGARVKESFILRSAQQEEALHRIWYALRRNRFHPLRYIINDNFILRSVQQEEALHHIWYALRRWRLVSRRIVLFPTTACSSINRR
ncbi:unnamed protein product [Spirodela intermedia]|uniref:Uncharacterized protein n=1 Tax=Spirodela intermedia TaxID=51605 RepID=A0A7I8L1X1_SPIIN|nr:unnamed protein product [Spirodela intermedia]